MARRVVIGLLALSITACATAPSGPTPAAGPAPAPPAAAVSVGSQLVAVIGTPFYQIYKTGVCAATLVVAPPMSGLVAMTDRDDRQVIRRRIDEGTTQNCGGSWILTPASQ
jgi:hypothetical protein